MRKTKLLIAVAVTHLSTLPSLADHVLEFRGADTRYRFADWNYTFGSSAVIDLFYVGAPGSNEFNLGGGYTFRSGKLRVSPLLYAVLAKEGSQRGVKLALLVAWEQRRWKLNSFLAQFAPLSGDVHHYLVLDTLDFTRTIGKRWEAGVSSGFFRTEETWNPQVGPLVKLNDRLGAWGVSYRFGPQREFRVTRLFAFRP